jgi:hypothetical protein
VVEVKASELDAGSNSESEPERGRHIIDVEISVTVATTKLHSGELDEIEEGELLFPFTDVGEGYHVSVHH